MKPIGLPELEAEYMASKLLNKQIIPKDYQAIRYFFATLPDLQFESLQLEMKILKKNILDKSQIVDDHEAMQFFYGKNETLKDCLVRMIVKLESKIPALETALLSAHIIQADRISAKMDVQTDYSELGKIFNCEPSKTTDMLFLEETISDFKQFVISTGNLLDLYGTGIKVPKDKSISSMSFNELQIYLIQKNAQLPEDNNEPVVSFKLQQLINTLSTYCTQTQDSFKKDLALNMYEVFCKPKDFFKKCKLNDVISPIVGQEFSTCYPQFYQKFTDVLIEDLDSMENQEKITLLNGFGFVQDQSQITNICAASLAVTQMQNPKGGF